MSGLVGGHRGKWWHCVPVIALGLKARQPSPVALVEPQGVRDSSGRWAGRARGHTRKVAGPAARAGSGLGQPGAGQVVGASQAGPCPYLIGFLLVRSELLANGAKGSGSLRASVELGQDHGTGYLRGPCQRRPLPRSRPEQRRSSRDGQRSSSPERPSLLALHPSSRGVASEPNDGIVRSNSGA